MQPSQELREERRKFMTLFKLNEVKKKKKKSEIRQGK